jgi:large subunit ribosomal protein L29
MKTGEQLTGLRSSSTQDLSERIHTLEEELFRLRIQQSMGQIEAAGKLRPVRKEIARIKTVLREKGTGN